MMLTATAGAHSVRAVTFERADAEVLLERVGEPFGQFFRAGDDELQAAEILRRHAAHVDLQKRRRGQQKRDGVFADERADGSGVERIRMKHHARAELRRQAERDGETERMEKRQDAEQPVVMREVQNVAELFEVREDVVMREHHALRLAGAAAGKNHGGQIVERDFLFLPGDLFQQAERREFRQQKRGEFFSSRRPSSEAFSSRARGSSLRRHLRDKSIRPAA